jgi:hypothetical protein
MATFEAQQVATLTVERKCLKGSVVAHVSVLPSPQQHKCVYRVLWRLSRFDKASGGATGYGVCLLRYLEA